MSRYEWPADRTGSHDRQRRRSEYNADVYGATNSLLVEEARLARRVEAQPRSEGGGGGGGPSDPATIAAGELISHVPRPDQPHLWLPIGPSVVLGGRRGSGLGRLSGRVRALSVSADGNRLYAGTAGGGLWYSRDAGASWRPLGGWADNPDPTRGGTAASVFVCGALWVRFGDGPLARAEADDEVLLGTGELHRNFSGMPGDWVGGIGLLRALRPPTWDLYEARWVRHGTLEPEGTSINRIIPHPSEPDRPPPPAGQRRLLLATSTGLWEPVINVERPGPDPPWLAVSNFPPNDPSSADPYPNVTDVASTGGARPRLWAVISGHRNPATPSSLWSRDLSIPGAPWAPVRLPDALLGTGLRLATTAGQEPVFVLGGNARLWRVTGGPPPVATRVEGVPEHFLEATTTTITEDDSDASQSNYDLAVSVHPDDPTVVVIGGAGRWWRDTWAAELYRLRIGGSPGQPEVTATAFAGEGIHADVHALTWSGADAAGRRLWLGCDGGVYRHVVPPVGPIGAATAHNNGLANLESGFVTGHPRSEGLVMTGTQDNGTLERVGDTVWRRVGLGDGGGAAYRPSAGYPPPGTTPAGAPNPPDRNDHEAIRQATNSDWEGIRITRSARFQPPVLRSEEDHEHLPDHERDEDDAARFYSGPAVIMSGGNDPRPRLAVGTNRVWFSEDFGSSWRTLPSLADPRRSQPAAHINDDVPLRTDDDGQVVQCRWAGPNVLLVLCERAVLCYRLTSNVDGAVTACLPPMLLDRSGFPSAGQLARTVEEVDGLPLVTSPEPSAVRALPSTGSPTDLAVHRLPGQGRPFPSFYVGVTGDPEEWPVTVSPSAASLPPRRRLRPAPAAPRPAKCSSRRETPPARHPVSSREPPPPPPVDLRYETLWWYDGNDRWYPTRFHIDATRAPVYSVLCDPTDPAELYVATAAGVWQGRFSLNSGTPEWDWTPFVNGLPEAAIHDLSIFSDGRLRLLRAAVSSRGVWETDLAETVQQARTFVRLHPHDSRRRPVALMVDPTRWNATYRWDASPDVRVRSAARALSGSAPGEAELLDFYGDDGGRQTDDDAFPSAHRVGRGDLAVDVLVHHRDSRTLLSAEVFVLLLWQEFPRLSPLNNNRRDALRAQWAALRIGFLGDVHALFDAVLQEPLEPDRARLARAAWAAPNRLPGWRVAAPAGAGRGEIIGRPALSLEVRTPRVVTFNVTASGQPNSYVLFMALVASTSDPLMVEPPADLDVIDPGGQIRPPEILQNVVRWNHQVAVTTVRLSVT